MDSGHNGTTSAARANRFVMFVVMSCGDGVPGRRRTKLDFLSGKPFDDPQRGVSVRVGMEATGHSRWFERLLAELGFDVWIGDAAEIKKLRVRKQKDRPRRCPTYAEAAAGKSLSSNLGTESGES